MGKKKHGRKNAYDNDGFAVLIPRSTASVNSLHTRYNFSDEVPTGDDDNFWKEQCKYLQEMYDSSQEMLKIAEETIKTLEDTIELQEQYIETLESSTGSGSSSREISACGSGSKYKPAFDMGIGLQLNPGEDPKLYRLSDPDGPLIPNEKFAGANIELKPGRGFSIGVRFKKKG